MLFNSFEFAVFLPAALIIYYLVIPARAWRARKRFLLGASYLFYVSWSPVFGLILLGTTLLDFFLAQRIETATSPATRRALLGVSVVVNLGLLSVFKYGNFIAENVSAVLRPFGDFPPLVVDIVLPIGISFYTFETLSYTIDVYRRHIPACRNLTDFALFLSFFPHLVAGPIVRPAYFLPQLAAPPVLRESAIEDGLARVAIGFAKKMVLADMLGEYVDQVFRIPLAYGSANVLIAIYAYAFQIYFDFSGYTDIALGLAQLFGLRLPENFNRPYLATSPRDFWQRWHISLSTWLRDYLYVSLGGNRGSRARTYLNLMLTMLLGGLWHGAAWNFIVWGGYHGALLAAHRALFGTRSGATRWWSVALGRLLTFHLACLGWVFFRCATLTDAWGLLHGLDGSAFVPSRAFTQTAALVAVAAILHLTPPSPTVRGAWLRLPAWGQGVGYAALTIAVFLLAPGTARFIYFRF